MSDLTLPPVTRPRIPSTNRTVQGAAPLWFICPSCRAVLSVSLDRAGMEGPCPSCRVQIRAPRSEDAKPIHEQPPTFAAKKKIESSPEMAETVREDRDLEQRRMDRMQGEWRRNANHAMGKSSFTEKANRFAESAWPRFVAVVLFFSSLVIAWQVLKG